MQQNPTPESPTQVPRALRIPINSAYTFGTKNKLPAVLLVVPSLVVLDRWRPPFGIAIVLGCPADGAVPGLAVVLAA